MIKKIISGGQTGADQMGLEVAQELYIRTGGMAPKGFITESGVNYALADEFNLEEITDEENYQYCSLMNRKPDRYTGRTCMNARFSDGTVCFSSNRQSGGTKLTKSVCEYFNRPFILNPNIDSLVDFIKTNNIEVLNVAGNRASRMSQRDSDNFRTILRESLKIVNDL